MTNAKGEELRMEGLGFRVQDLGVEDLGGLGFWGLGFKV